MRAILLVISFFFGLGYIQAQVSLSKQVIGATGSSVSLSNTIDFSHTCGETVIQTIANQGETLTQGFHQSGSKAALTFNLTLTATTCPFSADGIAEIVEVSGCNPPYSIIWSNGSRGNQALNLTAGIYSVSIISGDCQSRQTFEILPGPAENCDLGFINAFSPNGDGVNEKWEIENIEESRFQENKIEIFNRWGQQVWEGVHYDNSSVVWEGKTQNGEPLSNGTYFYVAEIADKRYTGFIELTK